MQIASEKSVTRSNLHLKEDRLRRRSFRSALLKISWYSRWSDAAMKWVLPSSYSRNANLMVHRVSTTVDSVHVEMSTFVYLLSVASERRL